MSRYTVTDRAFSITADTAFGFFHTGDTLRYFSGAGSTALLQAVSKDSLRLEIGEWKEDGREWKQGAAGPVEYITRGLEPGVEYSLYQDGKLLQRSKSDKMGELRFRSEACFLHALCVLRLRVG